VDVKAELQKKLEEKDMLIQEKDMLIQEKVMLIQEKDMKLEETNMLIQEKDKTLEVIQSSSIWQYFQTGQSLPRLEKQGTKTEGQASHHHQPIKNFEQRKFGIL
jgi:hypothetical protein